MINYKESKDAGRSVLSKVKVVDFPGVEEQTDDDGNVIVEAVAEQSHDEIKIATRQFNPDTGSKLADKVTQYNLIEIDYWISDLTNQIAELTSAKESWEAIKADYEALEDGEE